MFGVYTIRLKKGPDSGEPISGHIYDSKNRKPLQGVLVEIKENKNTPNAITTTNETGYYRFGLIYTQPGEAINIYTSKDEKYKLKRHERILPINYEMNFFLKKRSSLKCWLGVFTLASTTSAIVTRICSNSKYGTYENSLNIDDYNAANNLNKASIVSTYAATAFGAAFVTVWIFCKGSDEGIFDKKVSLFYDKNTLGIGLAYSF